MCKYRAKLARLRSELELEARLARACRKVETAMHLENLAEQVRAMQCRARRPGQVTEPQPIGGG